ncbi:MAG: GAF domain-containing protein [Anaerolineae bacterium]|nr:GAF domain-containing protein [Anaerolineae bacterium]
MSTELPTQTLWQRLTKPHSDITESLQIQRAHLLSQLALVLLVVSALVAIGLAFTPLAILGVPHPILLLFVYLLSRSRRAKLGSNLLVFGELVLVLASLYVLRDNVNLSQAALFVLVPVLFALLLLPARTTIWAVAIANAGAVLCLAFTSQTNFEQFYLSLLITFIVSAMAVGTAFLRERDLRLIQQQMEDLHNMDQTHGNEAQKIIAAAEIGRTITGTRNLDQLLSQAVDLISERFDVYYAQIFLIDEAKRNAVVKAGTGTIGKELVSLLYQIPVKSQTVVGKVIEHSEAVIIPDTSIHAVGQRHELLTNTLSEIALPLRIGGEVIGVVDIHSTSMGAFAETDISGFQAMADQIAIAIENVHLFERAQRDLQDIESLNRQLTGQSWHKFMAGHPEESPLGYEAGQQEVEPLTEDKTSETAEIPKIAIETIEDGSPSSGGGTVTLPLKVRGETIGMLDLTPRGGGEPDEETKAMLEAVAERVAMALDSTRLGEQAQHHAAREEIMSSLSAELQSSTDLNTLLRIVARTASHALETPTSFVHLVMEHDMDKKREDE